MNKISEPEKKEIAYHVAILLVILIVGSMILLFSLYMLDRHFVEKEEIKMLEILDF